MKIENLKNKLIKEVIVSAIIIVIAFIINSYISKKNKNYKNQLASINSQIAATQANLASEQKQYDDFIARYEGEFLKISKSKLPNSEKNFSDELIKTQAITTYVNDLVKKLDIFKPKLKILPPQVQEGQVQDEKGYVISKSLLDVTFKAKTDSFVYAFLKHLQSDDFAGYMVVKSLEISLTGEPNEAFITDLVRTGNLLPLIEAKIFLDWYNYSDPTNKLTIKQ